MCAYLLVCAYMSVHSDVRLYPDASFSCCLSCAQGYAYVPSIIQDVRELLFDIQYKQCETFTFSTVHTHGDHTVIFNTWPSPPRGKRRMPLQSVKYISLLTQQCYLIRYVCILEICFFLGKNNATTFIFMFLQNVHHQYISVCHCLCSFCSPNITTANCSIHCRTKMYATLLLNISFLGILSISNKKKRSTRTDFEHLNQSSYTAMSNLCVQLFTQTCETQREKIMIQLASAQINNI